MKKTSFLISLLFIIACGNQTVLNKQKSSYTELDFSTSSTPKVYFNKNNDFQDITSLNRENRTLNLYDQIVFLNETDFLKHKDNTFFDLTALENFENDKEDIKIKVSSFCSPSQTNLANSQEENRMFQELVSRSLHPSLSIIDLVPKSFLLEHLNKEFYCTFIFSVRNTSKNFTRYTLTQQKIQADFSNKQKTPLGLAQETHTGYKYTSTNYILNKNNIQTTLLLNNSNQSITSYEMFCNGKQVMTVPSLKIDTSPIFSHLINVPDLPKGLKSCHFFSKNNNKIIGLTSPFLLDFDSLNINNKSIDLSLIEEPEFIMTGRTPLIAPDIIKTKFKPKNRKYTKLTEMELFPNPIQKLNSYIHFKNLNDVFLSGSIDSIEMTVKTECLDNTYGYYKNFMPYNELFDSPTEINITRLPLKEKTPIAVALPSNIFEIGLTFDQWFRGLMVVQDAIDEYESRLSRKDIKSKKRIQITNDYYQYKMKQEKIIQDIKQDIICLYKITLEDKNNPQNKREFKTQAYKILWSREDYGVNYTAFPDGKNPFISIDDQMLKSKYTESIHFKSKMGYLSLNFFDLIESSNLKAENYGLESFSLICRDIINRKFQLSWPYNNVINNQIVLENLFQRPEFQKYIKKFENNLVKCRILFYGQNNLLKYFSGEMRLDNIDTDDIKISRPGHMLANVVRFVKKYKSDIEKRD